MLLSQKCIHWKVHRIVWFTESLFFCLKWLSIFFFITTFLVDQNYLLLKKLFDCLTVRWCQIWSTISWEQSSQVVQTCCRSLELIHRLAQVWECEKRAQVSTGMRVTFRCKWMNEACVQSPVTQSRQECMVITRIAQYADRPSVLFS